MVGQFHGTALAQDTGDGLLQRLTCLFIDDAEHALDRLARRLLGLPARERLGHWIEEGDARCGIGGNHCVADAVSVTRSHCWRVAGRLVLAPTRSVAIAFVERREVAERSVIFAGECGRIEPSDDHGTSRGGGSPGGFDVVQRSSGSISSAGRTRQARARPLRLPGNPATS
jgi:hypothetical protein